MEPNVKWQTEYVSGYEYKLMNNIIMVLVCHFRYQISLQGITNFTAVHRHVKAVQEIVSTNYYVGLPLSILN